MIYIIIGVAGCGKTTIGKLLAQKLEIPFYDGDDFHPVENIEKMRKGEALNDADRLPWLNSLANNILIWESSRGAVLACSALKKSYRIILSSKLIHKIRFIYLKADPDLIIERLNKRSEHFFNKALIDSQFADLEESPEIEAISARLPPQDILNSVLKSITKDNPENQ
jgi:carbohydrate kinase (thermoresistant glucokinase family)